MVDIDACHVARTVHGHNIVVPAVVAIFVAQHELLAIGAILQFRVFFEADEELVDGCHIGLATRTVTKQSTMALFIGLEPEHQRVVLLGGAIEALVNELQTLDFLLLVHIELQRHAVRLCPFSTIKFQMCTLSQVSSILALTLIHRIVIDESLLVSRQQLVTVAIEQVNVHCTVPYSALYHVTRKERALGDIRLVGSTKDKRTIAVIGHLVQ